MCGFLFFYNFAPEIIKEEKKKKKQKKEMSLDNMQYHTPATRFTNRFCGSAVPSLNGCFFACSDSFRKIFCRKTAGNLVVTKNRILSLSRLSRVNIQIVY